MSSEGSAQRRNGAGGVVGVVSCAPVYELESGLWEVKECTYTGAEQRCVHCASYQMSLTTVSLPPPPRRGCCENRRPRPSSLTSLQCSGSHAEQVWARAFSLSPDIRVCKHLLS